MVAARAERDRVHDRGELVMRDEANSYLGKNSQRSNAATQLGVSQSTIRDDLRNLLVTSKLKPARTKHTTCATR
jgi:hypothetical protein